MVAAIIIKLVNLRIEALHTSTILFETILLEIIIARKPQRLYYDKLECPAFVWTLL